MTQTRQRAPVSIVCVSNDAMVLTDCLIRSVDTHRPSAPDTELIVVQNSGGEFPTAGAALNHGVNLARNEVCAFIHQDVYLHSLVRLEEAAAQLLADTEIGLLGALGITSDGDLRGRIRDRVMLLGRGADKLADVDSLDEVHLMARRGQLLEAPLSEAPDLAWHAYAVEYGARMRRAGKRVVAGRIPLTHNSLTTNLARLTDAHSHVGLLYPEQLPIKTTCGIIDGAAANQPKFLAGHRWRYRWLKGTRQAYSARRAVGHLPVVLSDIRMNVDSLLDDCGVGRLTVISLASADERDDDLAEPIELVRLGRRFAFRVADSQSLVDQISRRGPDESLLVTNIDSGLLPDLRFVLRGACAVIGFSDSIGFWLITGPVAKASPEAWRLPSATPLGLRAVHRSSVVSTEPTHLAAQRG